MKIPKKCPVCCSTKLKRLETPIYKNGFLIILKCYGKCNGEGYEWGRKNAT